MTGHDTLPPDASTVLERDLATIAKQLETAETRYFALLPQLSDPSAKIAAAAIVPVTAFLRQRRELEAHRNFLISLRPKTTSSRLKDAVWKVTLPKQPKQPKAPQKEQDRQQAPEIEPMGSGSKTGNGLSEDAPDAKSGRLLRPGDLVTIGCLICSEENTDIISLPCADKYCVSCLRVLLLKARKKENIFNGCHGPVPMDLVARCLSRKELKKYDRAAMEFTTRDRTYCSNRECGRFIPLHRILPESSLAVCLKCKLRTCSKCKTDYHGIEDCPENPELIATLTLAESEDWKPCPNCRTMIERREGCSFILCNCGQQFCYDCGEPYDSCKCSPPCAHPEGFDMILDPTEPAFRCGVCHGFNKGYILECPTCSLRACLDCRWKRL